MKDQLFGLARPEFATVRGVDPTGPSTEASGDGLLTRCLQQTIGLTCEAANYRAAAG